MIKFLYLFLIPFINGQTPEPTPDNTITLDVPIQDQINYIRKLALYHFHHNEWKERFLETDCPEIIIELPPVKDLCEATSLMDKPIDPLPPISLCEYKPLEPGCEIKPVDCEKNRRLCLPPVICDKIDQYDNPDCMTDETIDCEKQPNHGKCRYVSKCDLPEYQGYLNCDMPNPCLADGTLCLTVCDNSIHKDELRCKVENCFRFPNAEGCEKLKYCQIKEVCTLTNMFVNPQCCPPSICKEQCNKELQDCDIVEPPTNCVWGYKLGQVVSNVMLEPIQKRIAGETELLNYLSCFNEFISESTTIEMKCFEYSLKEGYQLLTEEMKKMIQTTISSYDTTTYTTQTKDTISVDLRNNTQQV